MSRRKVFAGIFIVVEGCSSANLNKAIGHLSETGKIGEKGNLCGGSL